MKLPSSSRCPRVAALAVCALLSACAATTPDWDRHFGETIHTALASQIINPEAARNADPVSGIDGAAAHAALQNYQKSFAAPAHGDAPASDGAR